MHRSPFSRTLAVGSVGVLAAGCALRPFTPSVSVAFYGEEVPPPPAVAQARLSSADLAARWRLPSEDPFGVYTKSTLLSAMDALAADAELPAIEELDVVHDAHDAAARVATTQFPKNVAFFVDLRGAASVAFGATLREQTPKERPVAPILTFANWPDEAGFIPAEETLAACLRYAPKQPPADGGPASPGATFRDPNRAGAPVFLLDAWRLAFRDDVVGPEVFDNRYALGDADFPPAEALLQAGITRIVYVVEDRDDADREEDDLHALFRSYQAHGIGIYMVDLPLLTSLEPGSAWGEVFLRTSLWVPPRATILQNPGFYLRSRSGFGGIHARPIHVGGHGGHGGPRGGGG